MPPPPSSANPLIALGPLDGRYAAAVQPLAELFSEQGLILERIRVELAWLRALCAEEAFAPAPALSGEEAAFLDALEQDLGPAAAARVKELELETRHDVKAVELYLAERLRGHDSLAGRIPMLHFACTSWDINSSAYGIMLARARSEVLVPALKALTGQLQRMAREHAALPMLARTHGQPASPHHAGQGTGGVRAPADAPACRFRRSSGAGQVQRRHRQLQRALRRLSGGRLAGFQPPLPGRAGPRSRTRSRRRSSRTTGWRSIATRWPASTAS